MHALPWMQTVGDPIRLYYTISDGDFRPDEEIVSKFDFFKGFVWLHIDKSMRLRMGIKAKSQRKLSRFIRVFRRKCKTPSLETLQIPGLDLSKVKTATIAGDTDENGALEEFYPAAPKRRRGRKKSQQLQQAEAEQEE